MTLQNLFVILRIHMSHRVLPHLHVSGMEWTAMMKVKSLALGGTIEGYGELCIGNIYHDLSHG